MSQTTQPVQTPEPITKPNPDFADVRYGPHERNVLDFWKAKTDRPAPLVIFIHGGGFAGGDKSGTNEVFIKTCLDAGYAIASINYRLSGQAPFPAFMEDGTRAVQFLRHKAPEWNIDTKRVAASGISAGAGISLWIGFHDEMAKPDSADPVERQSSRLSCMVVFNGQTSYDPRFFEQHGLLAATEHTFIQPFYGLKYAEFNTPKAHRLFEQASPINYLNAGDPPALLIYGQKNEPVPDKPVDKPADSSETNEPAAKDPRPSLAIHHPKFGYVLKEKMDALGIECIVMTETTTRAPEAHDAIRKFFKKHLEK